MKGTAILSASIIFASIIYAFATRYEGHVVRGNNLSGPVSYTQILDRWTGKIKRN